jgi:hypothetical protein
MHAMVTEWRKPVNAAYIVAGLPAFSTLSAITDIIKQGALDGFPNCRVSRPPNFTIKADVVSPGGKMHISHAHAHAHVHTHTHTRTHIDDENDDAC